MQITTTRCEGLRDPLGIDVTQPRLSWTLESSERGQLQTAYQIVAHLVAHSGDRIIWDSNRVSSTRSTHVEWGGPVLQSRQRIRWAVRVWDRDGIASDWSAAAIFELGLLHPEDWRAEWIAAVPKLEQKPLAPRMDEKTKWLGGPAEEGVGPKECYFSLQFEIPIGRRAVRAQGAFAASGRFAITVDGQELVRGEGHSAATELSADALTLAAGSHVLGAHVAHDEGPPELVGRMTVTLDTGDILDLRTTQAWQSSLALEAGWDRPDSSQVNFAPSRELESYGHRPRGRAPLPLASTPAPLLRKAFTIDKAIASARAYVSGVGYYELYINGNKVGDHVLNPAFTRYDRRTLYVTHDVGAALVPGNNAIGIILGNGFFNMPARDIWKFEQAAWRNSPRARVQLVITFTDGTHALVVSDETWKTAPSPIVSDGVRQGESYDARLERPRWSQPDEDEQEWTPACVVVGPGGVLCAQKMAPIKVTETLAAKRLSEPKPGVFVFDLGQNMAGWARLRVRGARGTKITIKYGERLTSDGCVDQHGIAQMTYDGVFQTDSYVLRGEGEEIWEARFTYHGFQYAEVSGWPGTPDLRALEGRVVHTAFEQIGRFECSDPLLTQLQQATMWSYRGNFHGFPTDCPHREKNGWTGDAHLAVEQALLNWDNASGYTKWIQDLADEQRANGALPGIVPTSGVGYTWGNGPGWDSALLIIPWAVYLYTGDRRILEGNYEAFKLYVDYLGTRDYMAENPSGWLGDWIPLQGKTPEAVTHAGYHIEDARIVAKTARLLGHEDEATHYTKIADGIAARFQAKYVNSETGIVATGSQTAQSTALYQGLVSGPLGALVAARLIEAVRTNEGRLDVGTLGTKSLPWALTGAGHSDLFYSMVTSREFPSWGHWIEQGATTLWEDWAGTSSRNHIFLGDISAWFYRVLGGINPDESAPGFEHIVFRPEVLGELRWVSAETRTLRGLVASNWTREEGVLTLRVVVPVGSSALVYVPAETREEVSADGGQFVRSEPGRQIYQVASGTYQFVVRCAP